MAQTQKEILRDTIMIKMHPFLDATVTDMLHQVITEALYRVDVVEMLERAGVRAVLRSIRKRAGLERRVYPHLFRKTTATNMVRRGCPRDLVAFYLGHANGDIKTLNKYYAATDPAQITQAFWKYGAA